MLIYKFQDVVYITNFLNIADNCLNYQIAYLLDDYRQIKQDMVKDIVIYPKTYLRLHRASNN